MEETIQGRKLYEIQKIDGISQFFSTFKDHHNGLKTRCTANFQTEIILEICLPAKFLLYKFMRQDEICFALGHFLFLKPRIPRETFILIGDK